MSAGKVPQVVQMPPHSQLFLSPYALQVPSAGEAWSTPSRHLPCYNQGDVYFTAQPQCIVGQLAKDRHLTPKDETVLTTLPRVQRVETPNTTDTSCLLPEAELPPAVLKRDSLVSGRPLASSPSVVEDRQDSPVSPSEDDCCRRTSDAINETHNPYTINALIDVPNSLTRSSRTSSLSSSLSSFRFGGSLSQLWATSLSSLRKVPSMKSTGNIHVDSSLPSLGNQYLALGGSLPQLSLTSLSRLLPTSLSQATTAGDTGTTSTAPLLTFIPPSLCVYPSQPRLATPFINPNGSITFGSLLSGGSGLGSNVKNDSPVVKTTEGGGASEEERVSRNPPGSLNTLAYVASVQKSVGSPSVTPVVDEYPMMATGRVKQGLSPAPLTSGLSPSETEVLDPVTPPQYSLMSGIKIEEDDLSLSAYSEVKPFDPSVQHRLKGKEKPYKCDYPGCGRSFSFPAHLRSHVQQIHISYRPCKCDFPGCGKRFYTPQHLNVHRRIHTGERPFVCPYADCGKAFTTAGNLKNHIRTHTGERPYACKFEGCNKKFAEMSSLKKHELTHTGEKPYKCRVCGKAFSQAGSRNTHERKHNRTDETGNSDKVSRRYRIKRIGNNESDL